jgi:radical SAM protein with 4Fe4S-binding SPASM domain
MSQTLSKKRFRQVALSVPHYAREFAAEVHSLRDAYIWGYFKLPYLFPLSDFPIRVTLEPTNECNFGCRHCHRSIMDRGLGFMDMAVFRKIMLELRSHPSCILKVGGLGEPALHPELGEFMKIAQAQRTPTYLYTNGSLLRNFDHKEILGWGLDLLVVSIDGLDATSFERIRVGGEYEKIRQAVEEFYAEKRRCKLRFPQVEIRHVIMPNEHPDELLKFKQGWLGISDTVKFNYLVPLVPGPLNAPRPKCRDIMREFYIRWDGRVPMCGYQSAWLGDLHSSTIHELWHDDKLQQLRNFHQNRDLSQAPACRTCSFR